MNPDMDFSIELFGDILGMAWECSRSAQADSAGLQLALAAICNTNVGLTDATQNLPDTISRKEIERVDVIVAESEYESIYLGVCPPDWQLCRFSDVYVLERGTCQVWLGIRAGILSVYYMRVRDGGPSFKLVKRQFELSDPELVSAVATCVGVAYVN